jgi:hypothetical protein
MILRRVIQHVRKQEWSAIIIDFIIVVVGVYMGIELGNWNEDRDAQDDYQRALDRLSVEIDANLGTLDSIEPTVRQSLQTVGKAIDVLLSCTDSESNRQVVNAGLTEVRGTSGLHLRRKALEELTDDPRLLAQQDETVRKRFTDMLFYFDLIRIESDFVEFHPLAERVENNPIISVGGLEEYASEYYGANYSQQRRKLFLNVPLNEACQNDHLVKSFYTWHTWQDNLPNSIETIRGELAKTRALLATP